MNSPDINDFLCVCSEKVEKKLNLYYQQYSTSNPLLEVIYYSSLNGGKRIRPALVYALAEITSISSEAADDIACAIELIHSYSLVHDDLPAMDDDDFRRGQPATHKAFGEALAILAGDAMHVTTFELLAKSKYLTDSQKVKAIHILASASGIDGMSQGQTLDIVLPESQLNINTLEKMHRLKTGALMETCILIPLSCDNTLSEKERESLQHYAADIGLCFQICDDILDIETDEKTMKQKKQATYPAVLGLKNTKKILQQVHDTCIKHLDIFGNRARNLCALTNYIANRND